MTAPRMKVAAASAGAALAVATSAFATQAVLASGSSAPTTYTVALDKASLVRAVDAPPKGKQESAGDVTVFSATLSRAGKPAGRLEGVSTAVDRRYQGVSFSMLVELAGGTIVLQGGGFNLRVPGLPKPGADEVLAVTGGTGTYAGAGGTARLHDTSPTSQQLELSLR